MLTFMEKKGFADVIKLRLLRWGDCPGLSVWALNTITCVLVNGEVEDLTQKRGGKKKKKRGESSVITEAKIRVIWPQAKEYQQPPHQKLEQEERILRASGGIATLSLC